MKAFYRKASLLCVFLAIFTLFLGIVVAEDSPIFYEPSLNESASVIDESVSVMDYYTPDVEVAYAFNNSEDISNCSLSVLDNSENSINIMYNVTETSGYSSSLKSGSIVLSPNETKNRLFNPGDFPSGNTKIKVTDEIAEVKNFYYINASSDGIIRNLPTKISEEEFNIDNIENGAVTENKIEITIKVKGAQEQTLPVANFHSNVSEGYAPLSVQFTDLSQNADSLLWRFGDGTTSLTRNPTHTYSTAGIYTINLTASNANSTDSKTATINVLKSTPILTWDNPTDITYGTLLSSTQLDAAASVPGTFVYTPSSGTVLSAGTQTLKVDFTPTDTVNYNSVSQNATINVKKATPTVTWNNPTDIVYGTLLSSTQLNAVASVPGTFVYTPAAGTVLPAGTQTLSTVFTPLDTANYTTTTANVSMNVKPGSFSSIVSSGFHAPSTFGSNGYDYIWFNSNFKASGVKDGTKIYITNSTIVTAMGNFSVPGAIITFSSAATSTTTTFDQSQNAWITTVPLSGTDDIFLSGVLPSIESGDLPQDSQATLSGYFSTNTPSISINWKWGAAVYTSSLPYNDLGVKASHNLASGYNNGDQAGTPENLKSYLVAGARGGGGSNWCGSWSGTKSVNP